MQNQEPTIAEILHYAADNCLYADYHEHIYDWYPDTKRKYSCDAIRLATEHFGVTASMLGRIMKGLQNLGLDTGSTGAFLATLDPYLFNEIQQQRYSWLKFCALLAEEQGV